MTTTWESSRTALVVADLQQGTVQALGDAAPALLDKAAAALTAARGAGLLVVHVRVAFRAGFPEVSPRNKSFGGLAQSGFMIDGSPESVFASEVAPVEGEVVVTKHRVGAFYGTDFEQIVRAHDIDHLVLAGYATSGVILSTLRDAADRDFQLTVLSDAVADGNPTVHGVLLDFVFPRQAEVVDTATFAAGIGG